MSVYELLLLENPFLRQALLDSLKEDRLVACPSLNFIIAMQSSSALELRHLYVREQRAAGQV